MADLTLKQTAEAYMKNLEAAGKKPATLYTYKKDLDVILGYLGEGTKLSALQAGPHRQVPEVRRPAQVPGRKTPRRAHRRQDRSGPPDDARLVRGDEADQEAPASGRPPDGAQRQGRRDRGGGRCRSQGRIARCFGSFLPLRSKPIDGGGRSLRHAARRRRAIPG